MTSAFTFRGETSTIFSTDGLLLSQPQHQPAWVQSEHENHARYYVQSPDVGLPVLPDDLVRPLPYRSRSIADSRLSAQSGRKRDVRYPTAATRSRIGGSSPTPAVAEVHQVEPIRGTLWRVAALRGLLDSPGHSATSSIHMFSVLRTAVRRGSDWV